MYVQTNSIISNLCTLHVVYVQTMLRSTSTIKALIQAAHHKLFSEDHLADQAVHSLQGQLEHLHQTLQTKTVVDLTVCKDVRP